MFSTVSWAAIAVSNAAEYGPMRETRLDDACLENDSQRFFGGQSALEITNDDAVPHMRK